MKFFEIEPEKNEKSTNFHFCDLVDTLESFFCFSLVGIRYVLQFWSCLLSSKWNLFGFRGTKRCSDSDSIVSAKGSAGLDSNLVQLYLIFIEFSSFEIVSAVLTSEKMKKYELIKDWEP